MASKKTPSHADKSTLVTNIEALLKEAVQEDLMQSINSLIEAHMVRLMQEEEIKESQKTTDSQTEIRQIVTDFVIEILEEQAPIIVAKTLNEAFLTPANTAPDPQ